MWAKVQAYIDDQSSYTQSPGVSDFSSVLVKSTSSDRPHFVQKVSTNVYRCDKECLMFKSTNGMCSHSLLVASLNGQVDTFVSYYAKSKAPVNYAKLGQHGLPLSGKKPSKRKASSKKTTSAVKDILAQADDLQRSKRARASSDPYHETELVSSHPSDHLLSSSENPTYGVSAAVYPPKRARTLNESVSSLPSDHQDSHSPVYGVSAPNTNITSISNTANFLSPLSQPPLLLHLSPQSSSQISPGPSSSVGQPFCLMFHNAKISRCQGCRGQIQSCSSPYDIILQHKEHVLFQNPHSGNWQMSRDLRNTYYHAKLQCLTSKHPDFHSSEIIVSHYMKERLNHAHIYFLQEEFGLQL